MVVVVWREGCEDVLWRWEEPRRRLAEDGEELALAASNIENLKVVQRGMHIISLSPTQKSELRAQRTG